MQNDQQLKLNKSQNFNNTQLTHNSNQSAAGDTIRNIDTLQNMLDKCLADTKNIITQN